MAPRNLSREAHLWYTISSPDYIALAKARVQEAASLMRAQVESHPFIADYAPVPHWGGVIEDLLDRFDSALEILKQGEFEPMLQWASRMQDIPRGVQEGNMTWMAELGRFMELLNDAHSICSEFWNAVMMSQMYSSSRYKDGSGDWRSDIPKDMGLEGDDIVRYHEEDIFPSLPDQIPEYAPDTFISCKTGEIVPWTGVWVPNTGMGTAALAFARKDVQIMQPAYEVASIDEDGFAESFNLVDCIWHPVKPTGSMIEHPLWAQLRANEGRSGGRCESGNRCPREGAWFTPAVPDKRHFKLGEVMPSVGGDYGLTIWQWAGE